MKKLVKVALMLVAAISLTSCGNVAEKIVVRNYKLEGVKDLGFGSDIHFRANLVLDAENFSRHNLELKSFEGVLYNKNGKPVANITTDCYNRCILWKMNRQDVIIPVNFDFDNFLSTISLVAGGDLSALGAKGYTIDYVCKVRYGCVTKVIRDQAVPMSTLLRYLDR
ncbi:MAG: hypothetical protein HUJ91_05185 [Bacteroidales bacterium]|nr:hypothetical protein [Bacteroidales bacterium]